MLEDFIYNVNSEDAKALINLINEDGADLNSFFLFTLEVINHSIETLEGTSNSVVDIEAIKKFFEAYLIADKVFNLIKQKRKKIKLEASIIESLKVNAKSVVNGVEKVAELNKKNMLEHDPLTLLIYLATA